MNTFVKAAKNTPVQARTTNNMKAIESSLKSTVDLFYKIGASRGKDITADFEKAIQENEDLALRIALWVRDVRGGSGERKLFRDILTHLETYHPSLLIDTDFMDKIPEIGRWDDLLVFKTPGIKALAFSKIKAALNEKNGLAAKWLPRKGPLAVELRSTFGWTPKFYRKRLVELTSVVETQMCAKNWNEINFSHVPSLAMSRYMTSFHKNASEAFTTYKTALVKGDPSVKINASAVYPYDIIKTLQHGGDAQVVDAQWNALPDYMNGANVLPLVDVSGSMGSFVGGSTSIRCIDVALSLGLYCADKNKGAFKDMFLTFSAISELITLHGSLSQKLVQMHTSKWGMNTNLHAAFKKILDVAVKNDVEAKDMPAAVLIMSDMQFDQCASFDDSAMEMITRKYEAAGYKRPAVIF